MDIIIHRGTDQIGGTVTEIRSETTGILIDFGSQLEGAKKFTEVNIDWGTLDNPNYQAVLLTHYHGDHIGEIHNIPDFVPVYFGSVARKISLVLSKKLETLFSFKLNQQKQGKLMEDDQPDYEKKLDSQQKKTSIFKRSKALNHEESFTVGDIKITAFSADHSAFDAYMFVIEWEGTRILHTGDYRFHGYQSEKTWKNFQHIADGGQLDYLITEGTMMSREDTPYVTEMDIAKKAQQYLLEKKFVFVLCSSTNIDYIASIFSALPDDKPIIVDEFQKDILDIVSKSTDNPLYSFRNKKVNVIKWEYSKYEHSIKNGFCMLVRKSTFSVFQNTLNTYKNRPESLLLYGLWNGYLSDGTHPDDEVKVIEELYSGKTKSLHTSGHVYKEDLKKVIKILKPKKGIIPIHRENQQGFEEVCGDYNLISLSDKEKFILD